MVQLGIEQGVEIWRRVCRHKIYSQYVSIRVFYYVLNTVIVELISDLLGRYNLVLII